MSIWKLSIRQYNIVSTSSQFASCSTKYCKIKLKHMKINYNTWNTNVNISSAKYINASCECAEHQFEKNLGSDFSSHFALRPKVHSLRLYTVGLYEVPKFERNGLVPTAHVGLSNEIEEKRSIANLFNGAREEFGSKMWKCRQICHCLQDRQLSTTCQMTK